jgi:hypothetical protein
MEELNTSLIPKQTTKESTDNQAYVYSLCDKIKCKVRYIGVSINPKKRFKYHFYEANHKNTYELAKSRWIRKNTDSVLLKIIYKGSEQECYELERILVDNHNKSRNLLNSCRGGNKPPKLNELDEDLRKIVIAKISASKTGQKASAETRLKQSISHKGKNIDWLNPIGSSNGRAFKVAQYDMDWNLIKIWEYGREAIISLGLNKTAITDCLRGRQKSAGGYRWSRV